MRRGALAKSDRTGKVVDVEESEDRSIGRERREAMARPHWSQVLVLILVVPSSKKVTGYIGSQ